MGGTTGRNIVTEYTYNAHDQVLSERIIRAFDITRADNLLR